MQAWDQRNGVAYHEVVRGDDGVTRLRPWSSSFAVDKPAAAAASSNKGSRNGETSIVGPWAAAAWAAWAWVVRGLSSVFLPAGYPRSVSGDYMAYQKWDTLQALCSSLSGLLATKAVLTGVGVGNAEATPAAATVQWIVRDMSGMVSRIVFAWMKGTALDTNAKSWRFVADILNDMAMMVELLSPLMPSIFLPLTCFACVMRAIVGVAGGATRSAVTMHQARRGNLGDVCAKDASQETAVNLIGLALGVPLIRFVEDKMIATWLIFLCLTFLHLLFNYCAVKSIVMDTLNEQRASILIQHFLETGDVLTPKAVAEKERILDLASFYPSVVIGVSLSELCPTGDHQLSVLLHKGAAQGYMANLSTLKWGFGFFKYPVVVLALCDGAGGDQLLRGMFHAHCVPLSLRRGLNGWSAIVTAHDTTQEKYQSFMEGMKSSGWKQPCPLLETVVESVQWRVHYGKNKMD